MDSLKTLFLAALLSAAAYGVYITVTGSPPAAPPKDAPQDWENPKVELPADSAAPAVAMTGGAPASVALGATTSPPIGSSAPPFNSGAPASGSTAPPDYPSTDPTSSAPPFAGGPPADGDTRYPSTDAPGANNGGDRNADRSFAAGPNQPAPRYPDSGQDHGTVPARYEQSQPPLGNGPQGEFAASWDAALLQLEQNRLADAHLALSEWFGNPLLTAEQDAQLNQLLDRLAGTVIYSRQHLLERPHEVQPGETLDRIAELYEVPWQLLANINGIRDPQRIRAGDQLKVLHGPFDARVDLSQFRLTLFLQGRYAGRFRIGIGKDESTPEGEFVVLEKLTNPTYYGNPMIDADDPRNPLGEFALNLGQHILIHGTNDPNSIGKAESQGCIRLDNRDIRDVFEILSAQTERSAGSKVAIRR